MLTDFFARHPHLIKHSIAVAVSGGADSMALALMMAEYCKQQQIPFQTLTVDHQLRSASDVEVQQVAAWMAAREIPHEILVWQHTTIPTSNLQASARQARYDLLRQACVERGISLLCTAHHQQDVAENLLLRLGRGAGLEGLAAMEEVRQMNGGILLARPLLSYTKQQLQSYLHEKQQLWIEDPSNQQSMFARTAVRQILPALEVAGVSVSRLAASSQHLRRAVSALNYYQNALMREAVTVHPAAAFTVNRSLVSDAPAETALRVLRRLIENLGGKTLRFQALWRCWQAWAEGVEFQSTLGGCVVFSQKNTVWIVREASACPHNPATIGMVWDGRFHLEEDCAGSIAPLGGRDYPAYASVLPPTWPYHAKLALPALRAPDGQILAVYGSENGIPASICLKLPYIKTDE